MTVCFVSPCIMAIFRNQQGK